MLAILQALLLLAGPARAQETPEDVLTRHGCVGCHSLDGTAGPGPTFLRMFERESELSGGGRVRVDDDYVRRSIREPQGEQVAGYTAVMPQLPLTDAEVEAVLDALHRLPTEVEPPRPRLLWPIAVSTLAFLFLHLGLSFHPVRSRLIGLLGEKWFQLAYSVIVLAVFAGIVAGWIYRPFVPVWDPPPFTRYVPLVVMPFAFVFLVAGYTTKNPASAGQETKAPPDPIGIVTVTRHPALWGFALWGLSHLVANGDLASILLCGSFAALAILGMIHIDARRKRQLGERWEHFSSVTSLVPFGAIAGRRVRFDGRGLLWRAVVALALYAAMLRLHEWEIGVSPLPYGCSF